MGLQDDLVATFRWLDGHADIWPWFADARLFAAIVKALAEPFEKERITKVVGIEARGFILAGAVAKELNSGVVPARKRGATFPGPHLSVTTSPDYRGRTIELRVVEQDGLFLLEADQFDHLHEGAACGWQIRPIRPDR